MLQYDSENIWAFCNLAFMYNQHKMYKDAKTVFEKAKQKCPKMFLKALKHWVYAEFKLNPRSPEAHKNIQIATLEDPQDPDMWILWAMMLRTVGKYEQAKHKLEVARKIDPRHEQLQYELDLVESLIELDTAIELTQGPALASKLKTRTITPHGHSRPGFCGVICRNVIEESCNIF